MPSQTHILETEPIDEDLAMLLVGEKKAGKSELASTAPPPVLFLDFDERSAALKKKKDIYAITYRDDRAPNKMPTAFNEMLNDLAKLEVSKKLSAVGFDPKIVGDKEVKTLVFDSVQTIANSARNYVMYNNNEISRAFDLQGKTYRVPKTYHAWGGEQALVESAIMRARAMKGINVIVTLHECLEQDERSTEENPIYTGKIEVYPRRYNTLLVYFNEVWRVTRPNGKVPQVQVDPDGKFILAATALGVAAGDIKTPNIQDILAAARAKRGGR